MSVAHKHRWIIADWRDGYSLAGISRRRDVSAVYVAAVLSECRRERKRTNDRRRYLRRKKNQTLPGLAERC